MLATLNRYAPKVTILLLFRIAQQGAVTQRTACPPPAALRLSKSGASAYCFSRTALKVPCFDGRSPTDGENSTSPVIKSGVSNFPLHVNVPGSRPTLPSKNSTAPENVTEFSSPRLH